MNDHQIVAAGNTLYWSAKWKTFADFLTSYMKQVLGGEWGNAEIAKPLSERHPIMQWYEEYCHFQRRHGMDGEIKSAPATGVVNCYLGLAYSLYLIKHNVELQDRLLKRLKNVTQFQGAYYELFVANGIFELVLATAVLISACFRSAGLAICAFLVLATPLNIYSAIHRVQFGGHSSGPWYLAIRLPLQVLLFVWTYWFTLR